MQQRLHHLSSGAGEVVQVAAVLPDRFSAGLLAAMLERPGGERDDPREHAQEGDAQERRDRDAELGAALLPQPHGPGDVRDGP